MLDALHSPQPPPTESILTALLNDIATVPDTIVLVIDDYHVIDARPVDDALTFLLEHLPPRLHLVIATREDPQLPLARLRAGGQLTELRAADFALPPPKQPASSTRRWASTSRPMTSPRWKAAPKAGLPACSWPRFRCRGSRTPPSFIQAFTGSHHFVLDYLLEEVLQRQSDTVQTFLLRTSILDRMCGPLCDAVVQDASASGQATLEYLERANLFLVPLDNERRWYRYHHLFADLLRQRLQAHSADVTALHSRASQWYEDNGLEIEAFHHAAAANDIERAERLIEGKGVPLHFRGAGAPVLRWLESLPTTVLDARPSLWVTYASALLFTGQHTAVEQKLQAAEAALHGTEPTTGPETWSDVSPPCGPRWRSCSTMLKPSLPSRAAPWSICTPTTCRSALPLPRRWGMPISSRATVPRPAGPMPKSSRISTPFGSSIYTTAATLGLGQVQEADNQLLLATQTYQRVLQLAGDPPRRLACEAHLGLARISYEWNDLDAAQQHGQQCLELARQMDSVDTFASYGVFLARLRLAQGDVPGAVAALDEAEAFVRAA